MWAVANVRSKFSICPRPLNGLAADVASPQRLLDIVRRHRGIGDQHHWRRDVLLHEDPARTRLAPVGQGIACLDNRVIGLAQCLGWRNLLLARRHFDAPADEALKLVLSRLA